MKFNNFYFFLLCILAGTPLVYAQVSVLTPKEALRTALDKNHTLLISANDTSIATVKNSAGEAGMLPKAAITATEQGATTKPSLGNADPNSNRALSTSLSIKAAVEWIFFDGGKATARKRMLEKEQSITLLRYRGDVLELSGNVLSQYYEVVRTKLALAFTHDMLSYSRNKLVIVTTAHDAGFSAKPAYLQAQMDVNVQQGKALEQQMLLDRSKRKLNLLLGNRPDAAFEVIDSIPVDTLPDVSTLIAHADSASSTLAILSEQIGIIATKLRENAASRLPEVSLSASYQLSQNERLSPSGPDLASRGPVAALALSLPIYRGGASVRAQKTLSLEKESSETALTRETNFLHAQIADLSAEFRFQRTLLDLEIRNAALSKENLDIAVQRAALGEATALELQEAEERYERSRMNSITIAYACNVAAIKVRALAGFF